ncbi:hypothetical protein Efla_000443 [Eimeria flavescens]
MAEKVMVSAVCWVPRGRSAQFPTSCVLEDQSIEDLLQEQQQRQQHDSSSSSSSRKEQRKKQQQLLQQRAAAEDGESEAADSDAEIAEDDDSDDEGLLEGVFGVASADGAAALADPNLKVSAADEAEDDEANIILDTDLVLVAAAAERDFSSLEVYVHDMQRGSLYVHHDLMCGGFPLCLQWLGLLPESRPRNLVAVGGFDPLIQIWDLDVLDSLEPVHTLGLQQQQQGGRDRSRRSSRKKDGSYRSPEAHEGPVMSLSVSPLKEEALASGSADETAKVWDLTTGSCLATYKHHDNKVQAVLWHPTEASLLVTASYDRTIKLLDARQPNTAVTAPLSADAEACCWNQANLATCFVSAEDGSIECLDFRRASSSAAAAAGSAAAKAPRLWRISAHAAAATAMQQQQELPSLLVSCGMDETARVWDLRQVTSESKGPLLLHEKDLKVGPLFSCRASDVKGVFGFGGSQVVIWDLAETEHIAKAFSL